MRMASGSLLTIVYHSCYRIHIVEQDTSLVVWRAVEAVKRIDHTLPRLFLEFEESHAIGETEVEIRMDIVTGQSDPICVPGNLEAGLIYTGVRLSDESGDLRVSLLYQIDDVLNLK